MIAKQIISNEILPLRPDDNIGQAMTMMNIYRLSDMPVVENNKLLGLLSEEAVMSEDPEMKISGLELSHSFIYVTEDEHVFEILGKLAENRISVIPVLGKDDHYKGLITQENLLSFYANSYGFKEPGSIIVLEASKGDYSLSEISRVIEMEGAVVIASFVSNLQNSSQLFITLKINQLEITRVIAALERYEYDIHATFSEEEYEQDIKSRYDLLMTYLNV